MKILILKPSSLGDVIHALPALRLLKLHNPDAEIHWWLATELVPLLAGDPDLAAIIPFHRKRWHSPLRWNEVLDSVREMRRQKFDLVIDLQGLARSSAFAWLANGAFTIGLDTGREGAPGLYDVAVPRPVDRLHAVDWCLAVVKWLGVPIHSNFEWLPAKPAAGHDFPSMDDGEPWLAICPGARWQTKQWPVAHFRSLIKMLAAEFGRMRFAIIGGREDCELGATVAAAAPDRCADLTGKTSLPAMVEWVRRCAGMVTNDTGPMHVAVALRKPVVALFGPTDPRRTGPYGQIGEVLRQPLPCAPCLRVSCRNPNVLECLQTLSPERAFQAVRERLLRNGLEPG